MAIYKLKGSDIYYREFARNGRRIFRSTGKTDKVEARDFEKQVRLRFDESLHEKHLFSNAIVAVFNPNNQRDDTARLLLKYIGNRPLEGNRRQRYRSLNKEVSETRRYATCHT